VTGFVLGFALQFLRVRRFVRVPRFEKGVGVEVNLAEGYSIGGAASVEIKPDMQPSDILV